MNIVVFVNPINYTLPPYQTKDDVYYIGVDKGAYHALKEGYPLHLAVGDFDSVSEEERAYVEKNAQRFVNTKAEKNETDSELAVNEALKMKPHKVTVYGGIGGRIDHTYANMLLLSKGPIEFRTDHQRMLILTSGEHTIDYPFDYISFFAFEPVKNLTLAGFKYPLDAYDLDVGDPLCVSNEGSGTVRFDKGRLLVLANNDLK